MDAVERFLTGPPRLVHLWFSVPLQAIVGEGVGKEEGGRGEFREPVVSDGKAIPLGLFLCLLPSHDELGNVGVSGPVARVFSK